MNSNLLTITVTNGRPKAFNDYLSKYAKKQTQEFDWLIVCDNDEDYKFPKKAKVVLREEKSEMNSMCANWHTALKWIQEQGQQYDRFAVLEDDDWYSDTFLYELNKFLDTKDLAGFNENCYYFVLSRRAHRCHNTDWSALATTGFRRPVLPLLEKIIAEGGVDIDTKLWTTFKGSKILANNFTGVAGKQPALDGKGKQLELPRHIGCKENWHGGVSHASGYPPSGGFDTMGKVANRWFAADAPSYLKYTRTPPMGTPNLLLEMPMT